MFADAADTSLGPVSASKASSEAPRGPFLKQDASEKAGDPDSCWTASLKQVEGVHLLPCHIKYSGFAPVSDLFRPKYVTSDTSTQSSGDKFEALLHGRLLRGQQQILNSGTHASHLRGFVVVGQETACDLNDLRRTLSGYPSLEKMSEEVCVEAEEPPSTVVALRPCAEFDELW